MKKFKLFRFFLLVGFPDFPTLKRMQMIFRCLFPIFILFLGSSTLLGQVHPKEALGRRIFESLRTNNFKSFYQDSIFSLSEEKFKFFLQRVRNQNLRDDLIAIHPITFPQSAESITDRWKIAFTHNWRNEWRHLSRFSPELIREQSFLSIHRRAKEYNIQWKTAQLIAIEILLPVTWENGRFLIEGDYDLEDKSPNLRTLFFDRNLNYRLRMEKSTYAKAFMFGSEPENSDKALNRGVIGNGSGQGDLSLRFDSRTPDQLFYFCPDEKGAGGEVQILDYDHSDRPNPRNDLLLTFAYGSPFEAYQIIVPQVLTSLRPNPNPSGSPLPDLPFFCERVQWIGPVVLPRGLRMPD